MSTPSPAHSPQLAQASTDPGFKVPGAAPAGAAASAPASSPAEAGAASGVEVAPLPGAPVTDTSARELAIGGGAFLVLLIVFFFVRNAFSHHLVRRRVAPAAAESAAWLLFVGLAFLSAAAVLAMLNAGKFLTLAVTGTLILAGILALAGALLAGRR